MPRALPRTRRALPALVLALAALVALPSAAPAAKKKPKPDVSVMTRNLFLGADLGPGLKATSLQELVTGAGVILKQVDENKFSARARSLAREILTKNPDLVGMQEVALWRTAPCTEFPLPPKATTVRYDFLQMLLRELNRGKKRYRTVIAQDEFDFEVWVNQDGNEQTAAPGCPMGSEINGRLTIRDVILARVGRVATSNARGGHFRTLLQVQPGGQKIDVTRGWTRTDAKVKGAPKFRFVNTHLESFDNNPTNHKNTNLDVGNGQIRDTQAKELFARGGPAAGRLVVLVGDLNSDRRTEVKPGDGLAYRALEAAGFRERSTSRPLSCCLEADILTANGGGRLSQFDHQVDHVMTNAPRRVKLISSSVTGRTPYKGFFGSDHAGVFSGLLIS